MIRRLGLAAYENRQMISMYEKDRHSAALIEEPQAVVDISI